MNRSERLQKIAELNMAFENNAGADLSSCRSNYQQCKDQLDQLRVYREEYHERLHTKMQHSITANEIRDFQFFFSSLDLAIEQQAQILDQSAAQVEQSRLNWLEKKQDVSKMSKAAENLKNREMADSNKREQQAADELSQLLFKAELGSRSHNHH